MARVADLRQRGNPANIFKNGVIGERTVTGLEILTLENLGYVWQPNSFQYIKP